ncbi:MAG TPA: type II toxin-antitoxin system RelE/ParE family toxin [Burkholderiaceae bacterium]|nr:type II toxin-antitoxin system RelE/ParE family toxin [Burkholderiaceae bacterium]
MPEEAVFTMKLEPELRDAFMAEAEASHRPASQVVRELLTHDNPVDLSAEQDRADIVDFIAQDNPRAAIRMDELFGAASGRLAEHPLIGRPG